MPSLILTDNEHSALIRNITMLTEELECCVATRNRKDVKTLRRVNKKLLKCKCDHLTNKVNRLNGR